MPISRYEAYLTNETDYQWNRTLPKLGVAAQSITAAVSMLTAFSIKFFYETKRRGKPKIKNMISFKKLNIIYNISFIIIAIFHLYVIKSSAYVPFLLPYTLPSFVNSFMLALLLTDDEVKNFFKLKFSKWKEQEIFYMQKINFFKRKDNVNHFSSADIETDVENDFQEVDLRKQYPSQVKMIKVQERSRKPE